MGVLAGSVNWVTCARRGVPPATWAACSRLGRLPMCRLVHRSHLQTLSEGCWAPWSVPEPLAGALRLVPAEGGGRGLSGRLDATWGRDQRVPTSLAMAAGNTPDLRPALSADILLAPNQKTGELRGHGRVFRSCRKQRARASGSLGFCRRRSPKGLACACRRHAAAALNQALLLP